MKFPDATSAEIDQAMLSAAEAFTVFRKNNLRERAVYLRTIAAHLDRRKDVLIETAHRETHLDKDRLDVEWTRTLFQLRSYADACEQGAWLDIRIDTAVNQEPRQPDLRKMLVPLGPVVVFGASNFPFAYSTAGGDTACALAAGCPVILKAHPAHAETSEGVAEAVRTAAAECGLPEGIFTHLHGASFDVGKVLVEHSLTAAVGFTGSLEGGRALADLAAARERPIPVFAEMGSINPVFLLPTELARNTGALAEKLAISITQSAGQFCTNPGVLVAIEGPALESFREALAFRIAGVAPAEMLHPGIAKNFQHRRADVLEREGVSVVGTLSCPVGRNESIPTLAEVAADKFLADKSLRGEVFGPFSLLVRCRDAAQMQAVAESLDGQLTCTLIATPDEAGAQPALLDALQRSCGRFIFNGVPTGVRVALAMHHGGPYPATTDSRFTAVGADGIRRFARPVCYQDFPESLLPPELADANALGLWRTINGQLTQEATSPE
ncbi:MAG: Aldehyde dehydrogenase [Flaviaesturariibacter sp.]|nr:Aldehyde dehydrogenase [Flaviaesturariibacter sp.]